MDKIEAGQKVTPVKKKTFDTCPGRNSGKSSRTSMPRYFSGNMEARGLRQCFSETCNQSTDFWIYNGSDNVEIG
jgi:hypothetical protein